MNASFPHFFQPSVPLELETVDLDERLQLYNLNCDFAEALQFVGAIIDPVVDELSGIFWRYMMRSPSVREAYPADVWPRLKAKSSKLTRRKFQGPIDQQWVTVLADQGDLCTNHNLHGRVLIAALEECYDLCFERIAAATAHDQAQLKRCVSVIHRLRTVEDELVLTRVNHNLKLAEKARVTRQAETFRSQVIGALERLENASEQVEVRAVQSSTQAGCMLQRSAEVAASTEESAGAMRTAADMVDCLAEKLDSAQEQLGKAVTIADQAQAEAAASKHIIDGLAGAVQSVDAIVEAIRSIAGQTRLLALNATIEAARAGPAGRGFAVVAQEVKSLAVQTRAATEQATEMISRIQQATGRTVESGEAVARWVGDVRQAARQSYDGINAQLTIAASISAAVDETSLSFDGVSTHMKEVRNAAESVAASMGATEAASGEARTDLQSLRLGVAAFLELIEQELR
jgi:methyl-accepting chemotaxis protein